MTALVPYYDQVQSHYDLSNDFFALFLDKSRTYSCAYFERDDLSLDDAQLAKVDLSLGKCELQPDQRLLDIGCGWGATLRRAVERYRVRGIGLTLSKEQAAYAREGLSDLGDRVEIRLQGWEEFDEPVDRIVSIGAFEHFREERYEAFFAKCHRLLPAGAPMLLHSIVYPENEVLERPGMAPTYEHVLFLKFIGKQIFPGGQLRTASLIQRYAKRAGFLVTRVQSLQPHYAQTLVHWSARLEKNREAATALTSAETYDTYQRYLTGCARYFASGHVDVVQLSLRKA